MKLSIVICVYNTLEIYLDECLASIYASTLSKAEYEVILVDDGSIRDYSSLIKKYPIRYYKIENRGPAGARLYGAQHADGEYLAFVDSDDAVSVNYYLPMLNAAEKSNADIVVNGWAFYTTRSRRTCYEDSTMATTICAEGPEVLRLFSAQQGREHSYFVNWNKIYRKEVIQATAKEMDALELGRERILFAEDALFNFFNFKNASKFVNVNSGFYFYRIHETQISKEDDINRLKEHIYNMSFVIKNMIDNVGAHPYREEILANLISWRELMARSHYRKAKTLGFADLYPLIKEAYSVSELEVSRKIDDAVYMKTEMLGENFAEIDFALAQLYASGKPETAKYEHTCRWIKRIILDIQRWGPQAERTENTSFHIPVRKVSFKNKVIHNYYLYTLGTILFKKGSKTRAFLKRFL